MRDTDGLGGVIIRGDASQGLPVCSMVLSDDEFKLFSHLVYNESGLIIKETKKEFLQARLQKRLQANNLTSYYRYYKFVTDKTRGQRELLDLVDSLTINETSFFRNRPQFDLFSDLIIPALLKKKSTEDRKLRLWSAGCSRGQEPYSIAMSVLMQEESLNTWDIKILASDISLRMLENAQKGIYSERDTEAISPEVRARYFDKIDENFHIKQQVKNLVVFDYHNLKHENGLKGLDVIFCRNVMIYFDHEEQSRLIEKFYHGLADDGYLFLGHAESLQGLSDKFKFIYHNKGTVYQKISPGSR
jgi:chemotaxis protein methyltransferase CheR